MLKIILQVIFAIAALLSFRYLFDFMTYCVKNGAKSATVKQIGWTIGMIATIIVVFFMFNWNWLT